jgi:hypothetical protein
MATATRKTRDSKPRGTGTAADSGAAGTGRTGLSRAVIWTGLALGTAVTVLAVMNGVRVPRLETVLSVLATWALLALLAIAVAELLRRHHRAIAGHAARHGKRGALAAARGTRSGARSATAWLAAKAAPRWENRERQPLMFRKLRGKPEDPAAEPAPEAEAPAPGAAPHAPPPDDTDGGTTSMTASKIAPGRRARRAAARTGGSIPSEWGPVIAQVADFEPEDDGELLEWMTRQVTGLSGWAEALVDFYEHCTAVVGIDPKASAMLHDVADAAAGAAETMGAAKAKFTEHYELPREFAANGGLMTHDGRWVTGEGA